MHCFRKYFQFLSLYYMLQSCNPQHHLWTLKRIRDFSVFIGISRHCSLVNPSLTVLKDPACLDFFVQEFHKETLYYYNIFHYKNNITFNFMSQLPSFNIVDLQF